MLAGTQQSVELKLALDQEQQKSKKLEESMRKLDEEMRRTDELLYQMIPKQVADRLRRGENPIDTCEMFDSVSILFSDVVTFTEICSRITPMEVVSMLNAMYSIFDTLTERNNVYKVETIGDAYMVVAGAPEKDNNHAEKVCDMALDMVDAITDLKDPSTGQHLRIRVGVHSGAVVAGIVGLKMPRYCLFGDSVNTASRMESTSTAMKVHVSQSTKEVLGPIYKLVERGEIEVKGKGTMKTYWLEERENRLPLQLPAAILHPISTFAPTNVSNTPSSGNASSSGDRRISVTQLPTKAILPPIMKKNAQVEGVEERNRIYSPVTFKDVARRSIANSPVRNLFSNVEYGRESRSNSTGHVFLRSPSDIFGSLILDTEEFLEDLQISRASPANKSQINRPFSPVAPFRIGSAPAKPRSSNPDQFTTEELAAMEQLTPPATAPAKEIITCHMVQAITTTSQDKPSQAKKITFSPSLTTLFPTAENDTQGNSDSPELGPETPVRSMSAPLPMSKTARKAFLAAKQTKTLKKLDKMIEEVHEVDAAQRNVTRMRVTAGSVVEGCPILLPQPQIVNSMSDSSICNHGHSHNHGAEAHMLRCPNRHAPKLANSQSFSNATRSNTEAAYPCCAGYAQNNNNFARQNRMHSNACQML